MPPLGGISRCVEDTVDGHRPGRVFIEDRKGKAAHKSPAISFMGNAIQLRPLKETQLSQKLELSPELRTLYVFKEESQHIFKEVHDRQRASQFLPAWTPKASSTGNKYVAKFVTTLHNWWEEILDHFFDHVTNEFVEGLNGALKTRMRFAFGYNDFHDLTLRAFAEINALHANVR